MDRGASVSCRCGRGCFQTVDSRCSCEEQVGVDLRKCKLDEGCPLSSGVWYLTDTQWELMDVIRYLWDWFLIYSARWAEANPKGDIWSKPLFSIALPCPSRVASIFLYFRCFNKMD